MTKNHVRELATCQTCLLKQILEGEMRWSRNLSTGADNASWGQNFFFPGFVIIIPNFWNGFQPGSATFEKWSLNSIRSLTIKCSKFFSLRFLYASCYMEGGHVHAGSCSCCCFVLYTCRYRHCKVILNTRAQATNSEKWTPGAPFMFQ